MPSLFDLVSEELNPQKPEVNSAEVEKEIPEAEQVVEETQEPEAKESDVEPEGDGEGKWLRSWLAKAGYDEEELEELGDEEVHQFALQRFKGDDTPPQPKEGDAERTARDGEQSAPPSLKKEEKPEPEKVSLPVKPEVGDELAKLEYDRSIALLVKEEGGRFLPVDDTPEAAAAAKEANQYNRKRQERLNKIIDDPAGTLGPWMQKEIERIAELKLEERFQSYQKTQEELARKQQFEQQIALENKRWEDIVSKNEKSLYKLGDDGQRRKSVKTGKWMMTQFGRDVDREFLELQELSPEKPQSVLLEKAIATVKRYTKSEASAEQKETPVEDKRKTFLEKAKKADVDTEVSKKPATVQEAVELGASTSLLEAILNDPDNQDNESVQKMQRNRRQG